jgi:hypothetical protein
MDPQVPDRQDPQESITNGHEGSRLRDSVGGEVVKLHPVVVAQPPHEPAHGGVESTLVHVDEAHDVARWGVGSLSDDSGTIHIERGSSPSGVSCPPVTSSSSDSRFADDRGHGKGSSTRIGGAMEDKGGEQGWRQKQKKRERI